MNCFLLWRPTKALLRITSVERCCCRTEAHLIITATCRKNNIKVVITKYPIKLPFDKIEAKAKEHGVILNYFGTSAILRKKSWKLPLNLNGTEEINSSFELCFKANVCTTLYEGKIYTCPTIACIKHFNKRFGTNLEVTENDYIDIYAVENIEDVLEFLCKPVPFCRYCNTKKPVYGMKWERSKKEIEEWI